MIKLMNKIILKIVNKNKRHDQNLNQKNIR